MTDAIRAPYPEALRTLIPGVIALANLGDSDAIAQRDALANDREPRTRKYVLRDRLEFSTEDLQPIIEAGAKDTVGDVRRVVLSHFTPNPVPSPAAEVNFAALVPLLIDPNELVRADAARDALRSAYTKDEQLLKLLFPVTTRQRDPKPIPPDATPEQKQKIEEDNDERAREDYRSRSNALQVLWYHHGSLAVQNHLLTVFDTPKLQTKGELSRAFSYCPDPATLSQHLTQRLDGDQKVSALFSLAMLKRPELRPLFLQYLHSPDPHLAQAAIEGLLRLLQPDDAPALRQFIAHWQSQL